MPQFELVNFAPQFVWMVVAFAILYFGIVSLTLPRLGRTIDARDGQIRGDIATAEQAKAEADRLAVGHDAEVAAAHDRARTRLEDARGKAAAQVAGKLDESKAALAAKSAEAEAALGAALERAMTQLEGVAADAASDIVEKLTGRRPATTATDAAVRAALS